MTAGRAKGIEQEDAGLPDIKRRARTKRGAARRYDPREGTGLKTRHYTEKNAGLRPGATRGVREQ